MGSGPAENRAGSPDRTLAVYDQRAGEWRAARRPELLDQASAFATRVDDADDAVGLDAEPGHRSAPVVDLGCGPGWYAPALGAPVIALDGARAMLDLVAEEAPAALRVQADLGALPFTRGSLGGAWASRSYVHLARTAAPLALADLHRALRPGAPVELHLFGGDLEHDTMLDDPFGGRRFSAWPTDRLVDVLVGAGFTVDRVELGPERNRTCDLIVAATRARTLPDTVGAGMRMLVCGLNPSIYSADVGIGFARKGNRFWPAALAAGLVTRDRDPRRALVDHGIGMTDLVKRATARADELSTDEYRAGLGRVTRLVEWLQPAAVCFVGLAGWRAAVDRKAVPGVQPDPLVGVPVYVMPSSSGLNARTPPAELAAHLRAALDLAGD